MSQQDYQAATVALREAWKLGNCDTAEELAEILNYYYARAESVPLAALLDEYLSLACTTDVQLPTVVAYARELRLRHPLDLLRAGRATRAQEAAVEMSIAIPEARLLAERFISDVTMGWGDVWARHRSFASAGTQFGSGALSWGPRR